MVSCGDEFSLAYLRQRGGPWGATQKQKHKETRQGHLPNLNLPKFAKIEQRKRSKQKTAFPPPPPGSQTTGDHLGTQPGALPATPTAMPVVPGSASGLVRGHALHPRRPQDVDAQPARPPPPEAEAVHGRRGGQRPREELRRGHGPPGRGAPEVPGCVAGSLSIWTGGL